MMKLTATVRTSTKKGDTKQMRREGKIPAILYSAGQANQQLILDAAEFQKILKTIEPGHLGTTIFTLDIQGKQKRTIIKDIQYQLTTYKVSHLDFEELFDEIPVNVKVPIDCTGIAECPGVKMGGFLRQVIRYMKIQCLPREIPSHFQLDVKDLGIKQSKRLSDIMIPQGVKPLVNSMASVVVVVSKRGS